MTEPAELIAERDRLLAELSEAREQLAQAQRDVASWRSTALNGWDAAAETGGAGFGGGFGGDEAAAMRATLSWRITRPLRLVRRRQLGSPASPR